MKKVLTILLVIFIIMWPIYFISFNKSQNTPTIEKEKDTEWKGVIEIWDYPRLNVETGSRYEWMLDKIRKFEKENPGVYIELRPIDLNKGPIKLEVGLKTGNLPDIAPVGADFTFMKEDILEPLDLYLSDKEKQKFKFQALHAVTYDGKMWGMPVMMTTYTMYLNLDLFRQRGVEPPIDGNWTYEEFVEKMKKLTWDSDNDSKIDHYGFVSFISPNYYNLWGIILSDGAQIIDENSNKYVFYGDKAISGVKKVVDLKKKYKVTPEEFGLISGNKAWDMFNKEQVIAVYPTGSWAVRVLDNAIRKGEGFNYTIANYPIGDKRIPVSLNNSVCAYGIFKQEDKGKLDMCVKFLKFISQEKYQEELEDLGVFPAKKGIKDIYENNPKMKRLEDCLSYTQIIPKHEKWKDIDRILQNQIRLAIIGEKSSQDALDEARKQIEMIVE
ncbi:extracellular solute-binding protein, family 1 [Caldisalinibacter kiritimatiensis]|uniref:Extracellular solute-binding protein, family 1 n=1 Tax=Caldisalinibacter kiritimatiensis TaxID=1304284 RepID=R1ATH9_9FIRM|nr:extracellular solute-binding protein, family 1 [Caldisalinibacter kiritimatiensis]